MQFKIFKDGALVDTATEAHDVVKSVHRITDMSLRTSVENNLVQVYLNDDTGEYRLGIHDGKLEYRKEGENV